MAVFPGQADQQDPEAVRRAALLAAIMGRTPGMIGPPGTPGAPGAPQPAQPGFQPTDMTPAAATTPQPSPQLARPLNGARPSGTSTAPGGMTRSASISDPEATNAATRPLPTFQSEEEWSKAHPPAAHTPYVAPNWKQRLLEGIFAGMQEFGHPGEGAATMKDYLGNIEKEEEAEKHFPDTSAAAQHQRYMTAAQGAEVPLHIRDLQSLIDKNEADAQAKLHPQQKIRPVQIMDPDDPKNPHGVPALQNEATGEITVQGGRVVPNAQFWQKPERPERPFNLDEQELQARRDLRTAKTPQERADAQARINDIRASRQRPEEVKPPKESHLTPAQKSAAERRYQKALDDVEAESRARASGTYVHPRSGELMAPMTPEELTQRKQRADDEYKDELEAGGETNVRRFNYATGRYEGGEAEPGKSQAAKPLNAARPGAKPNGNQETPQHQVNDEVMYQGKPHRITAIQNGKATLQPLGQ